VECPVGPVRVLAGPGSGKTRVLTERVIHRLEAGTADARRTMVLTFTRRAAGELGRRLESRGVRDVGAVGTFHATALQQLRLHRLDNGRRPPVILANRSSVLRGLAGDLGLANASRQVTAAERALAAGGNHRVSPPVVRLLDAYNEHKRRRGLLDYDDLLTECTRLLRTDREFGRAQHWRFRHFYVDEFQDVNHNQFQLLRAWLGDRDDVFVVGDPDQSIYEWNGSDSRYLTEFTTWFPDTTTFNLKLNHRSAATVVTAANSILGDRRAAGSSEAVRPPGPALTVTDHEDEEAEAVEIARRLLWDHRGSSRWSNRAVLARTNAQLSVISAALTRAGIPHRIRGRDRISTRPEEAGLLDRLRSSGPSFGVAVTDMTVESTGSGAEIRVLDLAREYMAGTTAPSGNGFAQWLRTMSAADVDDHADVVDLCTFHSAKGLEWHGVIIAGVEDGLVPMGDGEEERRLFYVAMTRAIGSLHLSWARRRRIGGRRVERRPSPFLAGISPLTEPPAPAREEQRRHHLELARRALAPEGTGAAARPATDPRR